MKILLCMIATLFFLGCSNKTVEPSNDCDNGCKVPTTTTQSPYKMIVNGKIAK